MKKLILLTLILGSSLTLWAQFSRQLNVSSAAGRPGFEITIAQPTPLGTVISLLCRAPDIQCEGRAEAATEWIAPTVISGTLDEILQTLLTGSNLNYISANRDNHKIVLILRAKSTSSEDSSASSISGPAKPVVESGFEFATAGEATGFAPGRRPVTSESGSSTPRSDFLPSRRDTLSPTLSAFSQATTPSNPPFFFQRGGTLESDKSMRTGSPFPGDQGSGIFKDTLALPLPSRGMLIPLRGSGGGSPFPP